MPRFACRLAPARPKETQPSQGRPSQCVGDKGDETTEEDLPEAMSACAIAEDHPAPTLLSSSKKIPSNIPVEPKKRPGKSKFRQSLQEMAEVPKTAKLRLLDGSVAESPRLRAVLTELNQDPSQVTAQRVMPPYAPVDDLSASLMKPHALNMASFHIDITLAQRLSTEVDTLGVLELPPSSHRLTEKAACFCTRLKWL